MTVCRVEGCERPRAKATGGHHSLCVAHRNRLYRRGDVMADVPVSAPRPRVKQSTCRIEGCERPHRNRDSLCAGHRSCMDRQGNVAADVPLRSVSSPYKNGYLMGYDPSHPLAQADGRVRVHRKVLYDAIGPGQHACHWCGSPITWDISSPTSGGLETDHVNGSKSDNRPENLVPSCKRCNVKRDRGIALMPFAALERR